MPEEAKYAIFDVETRIDKRLLNEVFFRGEGLTEDEAFERMREEAIASRGTDFLAVSLHVPVSIAVATVTADYRFQGVKSLAVEDYGEERLVREFWERVERFRGCLVSFNGRQFDLPVLELQALRWGCRAPGYFEGEPELRERDRRYRFAKDRHFDVLDFLTNYGAFRIRGGLDLLLRMIGMPGKQAIEGAQVQRLWEEGRLDEIHAYCREDVIQTYFLFLRVELVRGRLSQERYRAILDETASLRAEIGA